MQPRSRSIASTYKGVRTSALDVTNEARADAAVQEMAAAFGRLDGVVNSAGIGLDKPALDTSVEQFRKVLDVNVIGHVHRRPRRRAHHEGARSPARS